LKVRGQSGDPRGDSLITTTGGSPAPRSSDARSSRPAVSLIPTTSNQLPVTSCEVTSCATPSIATCIIVGGLDAARMAVGEAEANWT
jgi:hypothetical protein